ncbi:DUF2982 domain-containing protein [Shewanella cyperi]|uniref:DUF2982 domain-containing protein n=1 Tax=Shewanella cyperi TaxID=2814292 RepID=UPI001A952995|nr:DUF2982 domain-containing protein [Shewanella cyperi]QSX39633.1 DUF2982 domain-containing protein [Shewanella cyperi]
MTSPLFTVKPRAKHNGLTLSLGGLVLALLGLGIFLNSQSLFALGLTCFSLGVLAMVLGWAKLAEPDESLIGDEQGFTFKHRRGQLYVRWDNIQRIDIPRVSHGLEQLDLPFIGLRLYAINPVLDSISPRLATGLLSEQRPLMMTAVANEESLQTLEAYLGTEFTPLIVNGERYRGVLAMFGHRSELLAKHLGYHLYIPADALDREPMEVARLLRQTRQAQLADNPPE